MAVPFLSEHMFAKTLTELGAVAARHDAIDPDRVMCALGEDGCPMRFEEDELVAKLRGMLALASNEEVALKVTLHPRYPAEEADEDEDRPRGLSAWARRLLRRP